MQTRRELLKWTAAAPFAPLAMRTTTAIAEVESPLIPKYVEGYPVYGLERPLSQEELQAIARAEERSAFPYHYHLIKGMTTEQIVALREASLPRGKRFLEVAIPKSIWEQISTTEKDSNPVSWIVRHIEAFNEMTSRDLTRNESLIKVILSGVKIIDDRLAPNSWYSHSENGKIWEVYPPSDKKNWWSDNTIGTYDTYPISTDMHMVFPLNYYQNMRHLNDSYRLKKISGVIDSGFLHNLGHFFLNLPDWYWHHSFIRTFDYQFAQQSINAYLDDLMSSDPTVCSLSPLSAALAMASIKRGFRSVQSSCGFHSERFFPPSLTVNFTSTDGVHINVSQESQLAVLIGSPENDHGGYIDSSLTSTKPEWYVPSGSSVRINGDVFQEIPNQDINQHPPFLVVYLEYQHPKEKIQIPFLIPNAIAQLSQQVGEEEPEYQIKVLPAILKINSAKELILRTVWKKELKVHLKSHPGVFAHCLVPGTEVVHLWEWGAEDSNSTPASKQEAENPNSNEICASALTVAGFVAAGAAPFIINGLKRRSKPQS